MPLTIGDFCAVQCPSCGAFMFETLEFPLGMTLRRIAMIGETRAREFAVGIVRICKNCKYEERER